MTLKVGQFGEYQVVSGFDQSDRSLVPIEYVDESNVLMGEQGKRAQIVNEELLRNQKRTAILRAMKQRKQVNEALGEEAKANKLKALKFAQRTRINTHIQNQKDALVLRAKRNPALTHTHPLLGDVFSGFGSHGKVTFPDRIGDKYPGLERSERFSNYLQDQDMSGFFDTLLKTVSAPAKIIGDLVTSPISIVKDIASGSNIFSSAISPVTGTASALNPFLKNVIVTPVKAVVQPGSKALVGSAIIGATGGVAAVTDPSLVSSTWQGTRQSAGAAVQLSPPLLVLRAYKYLPGTDVAYAAVDRYSGGMLSSIDELGVVSGMAVAGQHITREQFIRNLIFAIKLAVVVASGGSAAALIGFVSGQMKAGPLGKIKGARTIFTIGEVAGLAYAGGGSISGALADKAQEQAVATVESKALESSALKNSMLAQTALSAGSAYATGGSDGAYDSVQATVLDAAQDKITSQSTIAGYAFEAAKLHEDGINAALPQVEDLPAMAQDKAQAYAQQTLDQEAAKVTDAHQQALQAANDAQAQEEKLATLSANAKDLRAKAQANAAALQKGATGITAESVAADCDAADKAEAAVLDQDKITKAKQDILVKLADKAQLVLKEAVAQYLMSQQGKKLKYQKVKATPKKVVTVNGQETTVLLPDTGINPQTGALQIFPVTDTLNLSQAMLIGGAGLLVLMMLQSQKGKLSHV